MENNFDFNELMNLSYLNLLVQYDQKSEFIKFFSTCADCLAEISDKSTDVEVLSKLKNVIEYKKSLSLKGEMSK